MDPNGPARFVCFGQVEPEKGVLHALHGLRALLDRTPRREVCLDIIGGGSNSFWRKLERERDRLGLGNAVRLQTFVPHAELIAMLPGYTAAVLPLRGTEPFGLTPVEAGAAAIPVITTAGTGAAECFPANYRLFCKIGNLLGSWLAGWSGALRSPLPRARKREACRQSFAGDVILPP